MVAEVVIWYSGGRLGLPARVGNYEIYLKHTVSPDSSKNLAQKPVAESF